MNFERVGKKNLVDEVYDQMRAAIDEGRWKEGQRIATENHLAQQFAVSRVVIREALQCLRTEHLVVTRQGSGSYIANPNNYKDFSDREQEKKLTLTEQEFLDLMEFRNCIEFRAIQLSAERAVKEDFDRIRDCLDKMRLAAGNNSEFSAADYEFHFAVVQSAHNAMFCRAMASCRDLIVHCLGEMNKLHDTHSWGVELHSVTAEKLIARDYKGAIQSLKQNNEYNYARLSGYFRQEIGG